MLLPLLLLNLPLHPKHIFGKIDREYLTCNQMKKLIAILVLITYMPCALGYAFSIHHCKGAHKFYLENAKRSCCKHKKMSSSCCKTVKIKFKKADDLNRQLISFQPKILKLTPSTESIFSLNSNFHFQKIAASNFRLRPPPLWSGKIPLYISYSVFRI